MHVIIMIMIIGISVTTVQTERCVNALSWSENGELLISSGDDQQSVSKPCNRHPLIHDSMYQVAGLANGSFLRH